MGEHSAITQRAFLTSARLRINRLRLEEGLDRVFEEIVDISGHALDVCRVGVWLFDLEHQRLVCRALVDRRNEALSKPAPLPMESMPIYCDAVRTKRFVATHDARVDPYTSELKPYLETNGITAMLDAAIYRNGEVVGVVCHEHVGAPREWRREERQFAATVADLAANFIEGDERFRAQLVAHELALKLKDAHRLDALGRLSSGVAHDLNNLLGTIGNGLTILKKAVEHDATAKRMMSLIEEQTNYGVTLVSQLVALGRGKPPAPKRESLDALLESIRLVASTEFHAPWKLVIDATAGLSVWADAAQFRQVFINLILNSKEAMPKGGVVLLRVRAHDEDSVVLEVIDNGEGIAPENLVSVFDPYFTTRTRGSGIGLSIVQQLVHQHTGELTVSSTLGDGTTMRVEWPVEAPVRVSPP